MSIYYTVYKTTNLINGRIYIGVHKTKNPNDNYLGSNKILQDAIKKYGKQNFKKDVLFIFDNEKDMWDKERELVNEEFISRNDTYNIGIGGIGWTGLGQHVSENRIGILSEEYLKNKKPEISKRNQIKLREENLGIYGLSDKQRSELGVKVSKHCKEHNKGIFAFTEEERSENGKKGAATCKEKGVGLFGLSFEQRSETSKKTQNEMDSEKAYNIRSKAGKKGSETQMKNKSGIFGKTKEERSEHGRYANSKLKEKGLGFYSSKTQSELGKRGGPKNKGFRWYNDGSKDYKYTAKQQAELSFEEFLSENPEYRPDRLKREYKPREKSRGKRTLTNGIKNIMLFEEEAKIFLVENPEYRYGRTNFKTNIK